MSCSTLKLNQHFDFLVISSYRKCSFQNYLFQMTWSPCPFNRWSLRFQKCLYKDIMGNWGLKLEQYSTLRLYSLLQRDVSTMERLINYYVKIKMTNHLNELHCQIHNWVKRHLQYCDKTLIMFIITKKLLLLDLIYILHVHGVCITENLLN